MISEAADGRRSAGRMKTVDPCRPAFPGGRAEDESEVAGSSPLPIDDHLAAQVEDRSAAPPTVGVIGTASNDSILRGIGPGPLVFEGGMSIGALEGHFVVYVAERV